MRAKTTANPIRFGDLPDTFDALCRFHPPRPIHDRVELDNATEIIDVLAGHNLTDDQADYLDTLATLVDRYETEHHPIDTRGVTGQALVRVLMEANDMTAGDVASILGVDRSLVAHALAGRRSLTWAHAKALGERFAIDPVVFMA